MNGFLSYENDIISAFTRLMDAIILGILWLICSIPIITVGASSTAFYYAYNKSVRQKRGYAWQEFFFAFKSNFKQSTKIWMIILGMSLVTVLDCFILNSFLTNIPMTNIWSGILVAILGVVTMWGLFLFPYNARFENEMKAVLKNAAIIVVANFFWGILLLVLWVIAVFVSLWIPLFGVFAPAVYMVLANLILEHIFKKYMTQEDLDREKEK